MIELQGKGVKVAEVWFERPEALSVEADILYYFQAPAVDAGKENFETLIMDITKPVEELQSALDKDTAYEVRRAEGKDGLGYEFFRTVPQETLEEFLDFFARFAKTKGISPIGKDRIEVYRRKKFLALSRVLCAGTGNTLCWHAYVLSGKRARLLYSAALRTESSPAERARIGRANRWLHWKDILHFKSEAYAVYDFGGWDPKPPNSAIEGINKFKESFGGLHERSETGVMALTLRGRLYLLLKKLLRR